MSELRLESHNIKLKGCIRDDVWWYEENQGIDIIFNNGSDSVKISWTAIRNALKRKDNKSC